MHVLQGGNTDRPDSVPGQAEIIRTHAHFIETFARAIRDEAGRLPDSQRIPLMREAALFIQGAIRVGNLAYALELSGDVSKPGLYVVREGLPSDGEG